LGATIARLSPLRLFELMVMVNIKVVMQILKKSLHWNHPILQYLPICIMNIIIIDTMKIKKNNKGIIGDNMGIN